MLVSFHDILPDIAEREARTFRIMGGHLPVGEYALLELFCSDPTCDCRRVSLMVLRRGQPRPEATISHAFEGGDLTPDGRRTSLDPLHFQADHAPDLLDFVCDMLEDDADYAARLERHYALVKQAVADPMHPCHQRLAARATKPRAARGAQLRPGTIGTAANPVMLRVPNQAMAERMAEAADDLNVHYVMEIAAGQPPDLSDLDRIGQRAGPPAHLSRHERRAWDKKHRRR